MLVRMATNISTGESMIYSSSQTLKLQLEHTLLGHEDRVWCAAWSPKGNLLASCGADKTIRIWVKDGEEMVYT